jgi:hypothetical protein
MGLLRDNVAGLRGGLRPPRGEFEGENKQDLAEKAAKIAIYPYLVPK